MPFWGDMLVPWRVSKSKVAKHKHLVNNKSARFFLKISPPKPTPTQPEETVRNLPSPTSQSCHFPHTHKRAAGGMQHVCIGV